MTVFSELGFDDARQVFYLYCRSKGLAGRTLQTYFSSRSRYLRIASTTR